MNLRVFPIIALAIGTMVGPALANEGVVATPATPAPSNVVAYDGSNVLAPAITADETALYGFRTIGMTTSVTSSPSVSFFKLDFSHALNPMQMDAVFDREIVRVFKITHSP